MGRIPNFWRAGLDRIRTGTRRVITQRPWLGRLQVALLACIALVFIATEPAAAQEFCESNPGQLLGMGIDTATTVVVVGLLLGILASATLRSLGLKAVGNLIFVGVIVAVLALVGGFWFVDTALAFVPGVSMDAACGGI